MKKRLWLSLVIVLLGAGSGFASPPTVLLLERNTPERIEYEPDKFTTAQLLKREMLRQALLIAARHEMGLATRDATLREPMTLIDSEAGRLLHLHATEYYNDRLNIRIMDRGNEALLDFDIPFQQTGARNYQDIATAAEAWSREGAVELLRMVGFEGEPDAIVGVGLVTPEAIEALAQLNLFSQYEALRLTHAQIMAEGESPERLGVLTRAYANLGQMTRHHWNSSFKAYRARGVMYAERLIARYPDDPMSYYHSAYAWAMFGHHGIALKQLKKADDLDVDGVAPAWVEAVRDFLHFRHEPLLQPEDADTAQLSVFLAFLAVEHNGVESLLMETGRRVLNLNPESYRVIDSMIEEAGVSYNHRLTRGGPIVLLRTVDGHLRAFDDLPRDIVALMPPAQADPGWEPIDLSRVALALVDAAQNPDVADPSWAILGRLIEETQFRQIQRRIAFMANSWGVEVGDELQELRPVIAEHPYAAQVHSYELDPSRDLDRLKRLFAEVQVDEPHRWMQPLEWHTRPLVKAGDERFDSISDDMWWQADATYDEVAQRIGQYRKKHRVRYAKWYGDISPHAPLRFSTLIEDDWDNIQDRLPDWRRDYGEHPSVMSALAWQFEETDQRDQAIQLWEQYLLRAPDDWVFRRLARLYLEDGDEALWLATLHRHLEVEDYGLSHERTRVIIAEGYVERAEPAKALPYAEAAAESWAYWTMTCAAGVNELVGDFERAELWHRRNGERYDSASDLWFRWCRRTGLGDVDAARRLALQQRASLRGREQADDWNELGFFYYLDDRKADSLRHFEKAAEMDSDEPYHQIHVALLADQLGDSMKRDAALDRAVQGADQGAGGEDRKAMKKVAAALLEVYRDPAVDSIDADAMDRIIAETNPGQQINLNFLVGMFLIGNDQETQGQERLMRAATLEGIPLVMNMDPEKKDFTLARYELRLRGIGPEHFIVAEQPIEAEVQAGQAVPQRKGPPPAPR